MKTNQTNSVGTSTFSVRGLMFNILLPLLLVAATARSPATTRYVWQDSPSPGPPYDTWANAAHDIQTAVDAAQTGDTVQVAGGVYATGGRAVGTNQLVNRVAIDRVITVESLMGPEATIIQGYQVPDELGGERGNGDGATRCVYLADGANLSGFTLTNGATRAWDDQPRQTSGGGVWCESATAVISNCMLRGNSAYCYGGGAYGGTLNNCTITGNSANGPLGRGGGTADSTLNNCIVYFNTATSGANYSLDCTLNFCCVTPLPPSGTGNINLDPQLASATHLSANSPCRGAGSAAFASGTDIDGEPWLNPPSIGCDEYRSGAVTGPLSVGLTASYTNVAVGSPVEFTALIEGRTTASRWDFGDTVTVSNRPYATHVWAAPGNYAVELRAYNESNPGGVSATIFVNVLEQRVHYVAASGTNPVPPYTSWATATTNIQQAVDAAQTGDTVLVAGGVYATGGRAVGTNLLLNRVAVDKPLTLQSVNGPQFTVIQGYQLPGGDRGCGDAAIRCVYLANGASLSGFTLTNGATRAELDWPTLRESSGGGVWCESVTAAVSNCVIVGNSAYNNGGGVFRGTLHNCTLTGNWASSGGGASDSSLHNCTLTGNAAGHSGGVARAALANCIVYFNNATFCANWSSDGLDYCCTTPLPAGRVGNITNAPLFVDYAGGNLRLQSNSPCINAGNNAYALGSTDLDGNPRIVSGTVDMGAYEYQGPGSMISYAWLQQFGLPTDGSADATDLDADGHTTWQEWRCGTCPTNALSVLRLLSALPTGNDATVTWESVTGVSYFLERGTNVAGPLPIFTPLATGIPGQAGTTSFTDTNAASMAPLFYRVGVGD